MNMDQTLSDNKQNLIFARNGTGKSFIARSLRLLDKAAVSEMDTTLLPDFLVSEESTGRGSFGLYEGERCIGRLSLDTKTKSVDISEPEYIFHVFSEDYVDEHLRNKLEKLDGNITHEIIVGKENADLDEKENELHTKKTKTDKDYESLKTVFEDVKKDHQKTYAIRGSLGAYRDLSLDVFFREKPYVCDTKLEAISDLLKQYETFKSVPADPAPVDPLSKPVFNVESNDIEETLANITSPSTIALEFKEKISTDPDFFERGLSKLQNNPASCPFCTQDMGQVAIAAVDAYSKYFDDSEAKETKRVNGKISEVKRDISLLERWGADYLSVESAYNDLKSYFPSLAETTLPDPAQHLEDLKAELETVLSSLETKRNDLSVAVSLPTIDLGIKLKAFNRIVESSNKLIESLNKMVGNSDEERKSIQNKSCKAFEIDFFKRNQKNIDDIRTAFEDLAALEVEISEIKKNQGNKAQARDRVVETFALLLRRVFADRYTFDADTFKVHRNNQEMRRGSDRTLSDGEKSALAFCYFIAQTHLRVESIEDYKKVYFVFDDPVTSMSFDYVYSIIQCLKLLRISAEGDIQFNTRSDIHRPNMLILTHNNYFFNVVGSNNVVKKNGLFQLVSSVNGHSLNSQKSFATPHLLQLKHILDVSKGNAEPDYTTPNSVRSVIEGMWKFCRPDLTDFQGFVGFLIDEHQIEVRSVLINQFSHSSGLDMLPDSEDIRLAAREAISVVEKFAPGQLKNL
jgi:FtsZ-binding cell division protein ZapB